jgi:glycerol-1-phosphate dehydrogenase [NAD(P)+]
LQERTDHERIAQLFDRTGFWGAVERDPFVRAEWVEALRIAPTLKQDFYTVLSRDGACERASSLLDEDARLVRCFV